jgi:hypothetical protein
VEIAALNAAKNLLDLKRRLNQNIVVTVGNQVKTISATSFSMSC